MRFSVLMPTYNHASLRRHGMAIGSILTQTFYDWELIIIDDGSTDDTYDFIEPYLNDQIRYVGIDHSGVCAALNEGVRQAKGEICVIQHDDDFSRPNRLAVIDSSMGDSDIFFHSIITHHSRPGSNLEHEKIRPARPFDKDRLKKEQYLNGVPAIRRDSLIDIPYPENYDAEDWVIQRLFAEAGKKFGYTPEILYDYYPNALSLSARLNPNTAKI